ncbi:hypothetical protein HYU12_03530 [Candidatus Woesearchaeota archaeon]|nr:hypothetical protein [Candidatus Woesearchaeota archaeon]
MAKNNHEQPETVKSRKPAMTIAITALLLNLLLLPGVGSLVGGKTKTGLAQLIVTVSGGIAMVVPTLSLMTSLSLTGIAIAAAGFMLMLAAWIWGIITGIKLIQNASVN